MITQKEFEDFIYSEDLDFDIETWGDLRFIVCQEFLVDYMNDRFLELKEENEALRVVLNTLGLTDILTEISEKK